MLQDATGAVVCYSDKPLDPALAGKIVRIACPDACAYAATFPDFPYRPSGADIQTSLEAPSNWGDYHLTRMAAYLHPPTSGEYTFWIASDDSSDLRLSTDEDPTKVRKIAFVMEGFWTNPHEWERFPFQRSEPVFLQSNKSYYIEAYQEQALQDDHLSVAWEGPGIPRSVIAGMYLTPWPGTAFTAPMNGNGADRTNGVLREYWTNYTAGSVTPVAPAGPAGAALLGRDVSFQVLGAAPPPEPRTVDLRQPLLPENNFCWIQTEGILTFVSAEGPSATLELAAGPRRVSVHVAQWNQPRLQAGQNSRVRVEGVCEGVSDANGDLATGFIWVPASGVVRLLEPVGDQEESLVPWDSPTNSAGSFGG
ncbi:MAG TPA: PA14 domain-containing protein, partial [Terriglobales bacterium]|nr:PA14 domain-containing protein [Terriglobales bacterium]